MIRSAEHGGDVTQALALHATLDGFDHLRLDVLGVDDAVGADALGQPHREPAAAGAEIGDDRAVADAERIHDLVGTLPGLTIRAFQHAQVLRLEEPPVTALLRGRRCRRARRLRHG